MTAVRRAVIVAVALLCAATLSFIILPLAIIFDPQVHSGNPAWLAFGFLAEVLQSGDPERLAASIQFVWIAMLTVCLLPLVITGIAGELTGIRLWLWYAVAPGLIAAGLPPAIRLVLSSAARQVDAATQSAEHRLLLLFFLTGVASGTLYWLIAGRSAGRTSSRHLPVSGA